MAIENASQAEAAQPFIRQPCQPDGLRSGRYVWHTPVGLFLSA